MKIKFALLTGTIAAFAIMAAGMVLAQQQEERRVNVASDSAIYGAGGDDVIFSGNVVATIGVWHLAAATLQVRDGTYLASGEPLRASGITPGGGTVMLSANVFRYDGEQAVQIIGKPVRAQWQTADGAITVRAATITYQITSGEALLIGDALLGRGAEQITGTRISININTGAMKAEQGRVRAVLDDVE